MRCLLLSLLLLSTSACVSFGEDRPTAPPELLADMERVEAKIEEFVAREGRVGDQPSWDLQSLRPHELAVVAAHFFDDRPAWVLGAYDNGGGPTESRAKWSAGDSLFFVFQKVFYPRTYVWNEPGYLATKEAALGWMEANQYDLDKMRAEFDAD